MMMRNIYKHITQNANNGKKSFAILDPDKQDKNKLRKIIKKAEESKVDYFFVGGSLLSYDSLDDCINTLKQNSKIPVILFPGNTMQINDKAEGILFYLLFLEEIQICLLENK